MTDNNSLPSVSLSSGVTSYVAAPPFAFSLDGIVSAVETEKKQFKEKIADLEKQLAVEKEKSVELEKQLTTEKKNKSGEFCERYRQLILERMETRALPRLEEKDYLSYVIKNADYYYAVRGGKDNQCCQHVIVSKKDWEEAAPDMRCEISSTIFFNAYLKVVLSEDRKYIAVINDCDDKEDETYDDIYYYNDVDKISDETLLVLLENYTY